MNRCLSLLVTAWALAAWASPAPAGQPKKSFGVYEYVVHLPAGSLADAATRLREALPGSHWTVLAEIEVGAPKGCPYGARVFAVHHPALGAELMQVNRETGPFAAVDRIALFEDENGVHASVVNPRSIDRTVLMDDPRSEELSVQRLRALREVLTRALPGRVDSTNYGEERDRGFISRTMGVMAGGRFADKIQDVATVPGGDWKAVAARLKSALAGKGPKWGLHAVYELELPEAGASVLGITGTPMDSRSFEIVGAGSDNSRGDLKCPGLAHAAAYPLELVVRREGDAVHVQMVDAMFRMKMYFEDAGKWAFMKNMGMPGSLADEIRAQVRAGLGEAGGGK